MFSNFKDAFKNQPLYITKTPQAVLDAISDELPDGLKYVNVQDGFCIIDADGDLVIDLENIRLPESAQAVLPSKYTISDVWTYAYNAQKEIEIHPDKDGCYIFNGKLIKTEAIVKAPLKNIEVQETHLSMIPPPFPAPFPLTIGTEGYNLQILVQRQPHESITAHKFASVDDSPLKLTYTVDFETGKISFTISTAIKKAKTIQDIVDANHIYNSFMDGKGMIAGAEIPVSVKNQVSKVSIDALRFWEKILELQKYFGIGFIPGDKITIDLANKVEELYQCFIKDKPFKKYQDFNEISGSGSGYSAIASLEEIIGKETYFGMTSVETTTLFSVELKYYGLIGIFGATVESFKVLDENNRGDFKIFLKPTVDKKMYSSVMYFQNEEELNRYRDNPNHINSLHDADALTYIS